MLSTKRVAVAVMIAVHISCWHHCLLSAKMARPVRGYLMPQSEQGVTEEPETNFSVHQMEGQADIIRGKIIADNNHYVKYE